MEVKELICSYVNANPIPDEALCPMFIQHWNTAQGRMYWISNTGERTRNNPDGPPDRCNYYWRTEADPYRGVRNVAVRSSYDGVYVKDCGQFLEVSWITCDGNRGKDGVPAKWKFFRRGFLVKGDPIAYNSKGYPWSDKAGKFYDKEFARMMNNEMNTWLYGPKGMEEFKRYYGVPAQEQIVSMWQASNWYVKNNVSRKKSAQAKRLEEYDLPELDISTGYRIIFQILDEEYAVFRYCASYDHYERFRMFIGKDGKVTCMDRDGNGWRITTARPQYYWERSPIGGTAITEWKPLKWIEPCLTNKSDGSRTLMEIAMLLRHPIVESLGKAGYEKVVKRVVPQGHIQANLKHYFGPNVKEGKGNLFKILGVNKYLLEKIERYESPTWSDHSMDVPRILKELYGRDDITDLSRETIDTLFAGIIMIASENGGSATGRWKSALFFANTFYYGRQERFDINDDDRKFGLRLARMAGSHPDIIRTFIDTKRNFYSINEADRPDLDIRDFRNYEELVHLHDDLCRLMNIQQERERARWDAKRAEQLKEQQKTFEKLQEKRIEKYEAEDSKYCIRVPHELKEITAEGTVLGHCVGGYLSSHATGVTNIMFLRKKEDETTPFYTIEVKNGELIQIHGRYNRWLGNDPDAIAFVYEWLNERKIVFDNTTLLETATGYCRSGKLVDATYLYRKGY